MIFFHGSNIEVKKPQISFSKNYLDFGKGFYLTSYKKQAEKWALRKQNRYEGNAIVNVFETVDMYFRGLWTKEKTIEELRYYKMNDQICITKQEVLDNILKFKESYRVSL